MIALDTNVLVRYLVCYGQKRPGPCWDPARPSNPV